MKIASPCLVFLLPVASIANSVSADDERVVGNLTLPVPTEANQKERELLFFANRDMRRCISRELQDFNDQFDPVAYRDMVFAEAGYTAKELLDNFEKNRDTFTETEPQMALMQALEKHQEELQEVGNIVEACQVELDGGRSAVGAGAMAGALLAQALEGPIDPILTTNGGEQSTTPPSVSDSPTSPPTVSLSPSVSHSPTISPTPQPTFAKKRQFPIMVGVHFEIEFLVHIAASEFIGGDFVGCCGFQQPLLEQRRALFYL